LIDNLLILNNKCRQQMHVLPPYNCTSSVEVIYNGGAIVINGRRLGMQKVMKAEDIVLLLRKIVKPPNFVPSDSKNECQAPEFCTI
jgi:hypothetical protein